MSSSALPSQAIVSRWNSDETPATLDTVLSWARVVGPLADAFLLAVGTDKDEPYKSLTLLTEEEAITMTNAMKVGGMALGPLQAAKIRLVFAAIWHAAAGGHSPPGVAERVGPPLPTPPKPPTILSAEMQDVIPLKGVVIQTGNLLTKLIPQDEYDRLFKQYRVRCGADMAQAVEPTRVQVSCYLALVRERGTVAVDFAVWKANADRDEKIRATEGLRFSSEGKIEPLVMHGPATLAEWQLCFKVFRACAIMCDHISPEMLDRCMDRITTLATDHPTYLWPLLYQTDVRARSEHLGRIGRRLREEKEKADANNQPHPYDPARPWEQAWHELAVLEDRFWERQFEKKQRTTSS